MGAHPLNGGGRWRAMAISDLPAVQAVAEVVHPAYPERPEVFLERLSLYPAGCFVLESAPAQTLGYAISHPWHHAQPPALDALLGALPMPASTYYLHDIALLPEARGQGAPAGLLALLLTQAELCGLHEVSLVAVNDSRIYWQGRGFEALHAPALKRKLDTYDKDARLMRWPVCSGVKQY